MNAFRGATAASRDGLTAALLVAPATLCIVVLFVIPIGYVLLLSVTDPSVSLEHYRRDGNSSAYYEFSGCTHARVLTMVKQPKAPRASLVCTRRHHA